MLDGGRFYESADRMVSLMQRALICQLKGIAEYSATTYREWVAISLADDVDTGPGTDVITYTDHDPVEGNMGMLRVANGTWTAQTIGWGESLQVE